jgi:uncharacterized protein YkwD
MRRFKDLFLIFIITAITGGIFFFVFNNLVLFYSGLAFKLPEVEEKIVNFITKEAEKEISTPPPLRSPKENPGSFLTKDGIIQETNKEREKRGLAPLKENKKLTNSAKAKSEDMFEKQYFSHDSPSGLGVGDLAEQAGYEFIIIGENLALGDFQNDDGLVQGWMDSPGHRENILNSQYQEIGVWVQKSMFEGKMTWIAVQHFALSLSVCPSPDETLKSTVEARKDQIDSLYEAIMVLEIEIKNTKPSSRGTYNQKVKEYNNLVSEYNTLVKSTELLINEYNSQVGLFNKCLAEI